MKVNQEEEDPDSIKLRKGSYKELKEVAMDIEERRNDWYHR